MKLPVSCKASVCNDQADTSRSPVVFVVVEATLSPLRTPSPLPLPPLQPHLSRYFAAGTDFPALCALLLLRPSAFAAFPQPFGLTLHLCEKT